MILKTIPTDLDNESPWRLCADVIASVATECIGYSGSEYNLDNLSEINPKGTLEATVKNS